MRYYQCFLTTLSFLIVNLSGACLAQVPDTSYIQLIAHHYEMPQNWQALHPEKVLTDYNGIVYVLTNKGLYRDFPDAIIAKDETYASLADKQPVDISLQEQTGILLVTKGVKTMHFQCISL